MSKLNPQFNHNYKVKYPTFKLWVLGGKWSTDTGWCVAPPLWKRIYIKLTWRAVKEIKDFFRSTKCGYEITDMAEYKEKDIK